MARYIDADKLCEALKSMASVQYPDKQNTILGVVSSIENFPTADVVPKSEVENLKVLLEMQENAYESLKELYDMDTEALIKARKKTEVEVAREIFEEIENALECAYDADQQSDYPMPSYHDYLKDDIAELKKKYTEDKD